MTNKTILMIFALLFLALPMASALELNPFADVKDYSAEPTPYGTINISNTFFWIKTGTIATYTIASISDSIINIQMDGNATLYQNGTLFDDVNFKDSLGNLVNINYIAQFILTAETYQIDVPVYEENCQKIYDTMNKTTNKICTNDLVKINKEDRTREVWQKYNADILPVGNYQWKIEGRKNINQAVDILPVKSGNEFSEWVWFNTSFAYKQAITIANQTGESLLNYTQYVSVNLTTQINAGKLQSNCGDIRFVNASETGEFSYRILGCNNGTNSSFEFRLGDAGLGSYTAYMYYGNTAVNSTQNENRTYLFYDSATTDRTSEYTTNVDAGTCSHTFNSGSLDYGLDASAPATTCIAYVTNLNVTNVTITALLRDQNSAVSSGLVLRASSANNNYKIQKINGNQNLRIMVGGVDKELTPAVASSLSTNTFYLYTFYAQGTTLNNTVNGFSIQGTNNSLTNGFAGAWAYVDGNINFKNMTIRLRVATDPVITFGAETTITISNVLNAPTNNANFTVNSVTFNATTTAGQGTVTNATLYIYYINSSVVLTNLTTGLSGSTNTTIWNQTLSDNNNYKWNIFSCNSNNNCTFAPSNFTFTVDTAAPQIQFVSPTETNNSIFNRNNTLINVTATDNNLANITIRLFNSTSLVNQTTTTTSPNFVNISNLRDGIYYFNATAFDVFGHSNSTETRTVTIDTTPISINFTNPTEINGSFINRNNILVNVSANSTSLANVTIYLYNSTNLINTTVSTTNVTFLNFTGLIDGIYYFNATATSLINVKVYTETRQTTIDTLAPIINITAPINPVSYQLINTNLSINWTITDINPQTCFYSYNSGNITVSCGVNSSTQKILDYNNRTIIFYTNDSAGNYASSTRTWNYSVFEFNRSFHNQSFIGASETFNLNFSGSTQVSSVLFNYNGTNYNSPFIQNGENYLSTAAITIPNNLGNKTASFYWTVTLSSGANITTPSSNQSIAFVTIGNCTTNPVLIANYSLFEEDGKTPINGTIETITTLYSYGSSTNLIANYSFKSVNGVAGVSICAPANVFNTTQYTMYYETKYYNDTSAIEYKYGQNITLSNNTIPQNINLYDLILTKSVEFRVNFKDSFLSNVPGALIDVQRQYIPENIFTSVETPITDIDGNTLVHLVESSVVYTFIISKDGQILGTFDHVVAKCNSPTDCRIAFNAVSSTVSTQDWSKYGNLNVALSANNNTRNIQMVYSTIDSTVQTVSWTVRVADQYGNTTVCTDSQVSQAGVFNCIIPTTYGDTSIEVIPAVNNLPVTRYSQTFAPTSDQTFGNTRLILAMLLYSTLVLMLVGHPIAMVAGAILGLFFTGSMFMIDGVNGITTGMVISYFIIGAIIVMWQLNKRMQE